MKNFFKNLIFISAMMSAATAIASDLSAEDRENLESLQKSVRYPTVKQTIVKTEERLKFFNSYDPQQTQERVKLQDENCEFLVQSLQLVKSSWNLSYVLARPALSKLKVSEEDASIFVKNWNGLKTNYRDSIDQCEDIGMSLKALKKIQGNMDQVNTFLTKVLK